MREASKPTWPIPGLTQPPSPEQVDHPAHYQGKVEAIDAIESALGLDGFVAFCRGNAMKYHFRAGRKGDAGQDLAKAAWYTSRAIKAIEDSRR